MKRNLNYLKIFVAFTTLGMILALSACGQTQDNVEEQEVNTTVVEAKVPEKPKDIMVNQINNLLDGDTETIKEYFGNSDVYMSDAVKDRVSVAKITFISAGSVLDSVQEGDTIPNSEDIEVKDAPLTTNVAADSKDTANSKSSSDNTNSDKIAEATVDSFEGVQNGVIEVKLHICTMDYGKTKEAVAGLTERMKSENPAMTEEELNKKITAEIASRAQNGEFDVHITMPVCIQYKDAEGTVLMTEAFKAALTGGWYNPTQSELISGVCPLREAAKKEVEKQSEDKDKVTESTNKEPVTKEEVK